ncbi:hypothetical protein AcW1_009161 [Taiwanofungus camphoratus]|nr:hypothetical protein AcV5_007183 [Antrodia cinnamomea]KAI0949604.1 hypothetical protein AcW1_009161 [Antrodia cinnamomea]KAI0958576.1 hypothetical protein AcV7_004363 [Antrodia cinnamomea]
MSCDALIPTDLWLERSRFNGMTLGAFSYGIYFVLTIQAFHTVWNGPIKHSFRSGSSRSLTWRQRVFDRSSILLAYICITFVLATIGFAGNAKYSQMIWIDLRNRPGGPAALIEDELDFWINRMALACYYVMEWFMEALLLQRCFIIWNWAPYIVALMSVLFFADIAMAILVLTESKGAVFYNINVQLAYLCLSVGMNILYTLLVTGRLLAMRNSIREVLGSEHSTTYTSVVAMLTESAALYSVLGAIYIVSFAVHSNISNLIFLSISHVQVSLCGPVQLPGPSVARQTCSSISLT